jgi:hypothetical protein
MLAIIYLLGTFIADLLKSRRAGLKLRPLSASSAQHYPETTAATSAAAGE